VCEIIKEGSGEESGCRTCSFAPLVSWYLQELGDKAPEHAKRLEALVFKEDVSNEAICALMDEILSAVEEPVRKELCRFNKVFDEAVPSLKD
jgi:hypothetical protein